MGYLLQQLANGLHIGAIYALLAFGYALTNGVLHRTNLAHGALFAFGGQVTILASVFGWQSLWLTLPATLALGAVAGLGYTLLAAHLLSRTVFEPLRTRSPNTIVAATLGAALVLMELARLAADTRDYWLPPLMSDPVTLFATPGFHVALTGLQIVNCFIAGAVLIVSANYLDHSRAGRAWRAVRDDPAAAALCGLDPRRVLRRAVLAGAAFAALAGGLAAFYFGNVSFGTGLVFGLKVLFVTAVGGYLSPARAAAGAWAFGLAESLWSGYFPIEWRDAWMFAFLAGLLVLRRDRERQPGLS